MNGTSDGTGWRNVSGGRRVSMVGGPIIIFFPFFFFSATPSVLLISWVGHEGGRHVTLTAEQSNTKQNRAERSRERATYQLVSLQTDHPPRSSLSYFSRELERRGGEKCSASYYSKGRKWALHTQVTYLVEATWEMLSTVEIFRYWQ